MKEENEKLARLIKQIQNGNQSAFEEFYKLTSSKAYFIALKLTQNEHDAEDILQESYIKVLEKINEIDTTKNITSWLFRIVSNKSKDLLRSRNRLVFDGEEESVFDDIPEEKAEFCPEVNLNQEELRLEVMAAIDELTDEKRACIMMMYFGDMSVREIAKSIEVPESTVKNRLFTARKALKARFEKSGNVLYGAALGGLLIWALSKTGEITASAFAASAASDTVLAGINSASATAASSAAAAGTATAAVSSSAATGTGIAAKIAALSVLQKVVAGIAATAVIGGSAAGVATVANKIESSNETTTYIEEVTTAPSQSEKYVFAVVTTEESTADNSSATETEPTVTVRAESSTKRPSVTSTTRSAQTTKSTAVTSTTNRTTTTRPTTTKPTTTKTATTTRPTTTRPTTTEYTTEEETTTIPTTTQPATTQPTTTQPSTTEPTTQAPATVEVEVMDMNEEPVATFSFTVEAGTEMTWEYLVSQIKAKGYEPKAGIYGDAVDAVAEAGKIYSITAEL